jgi:hypothetical protein
LPLPLLARPRLHWGQAGQAPGEPHFRIKVWSRAGRNCGPSSFSMGVAWIQLWSGIIARERCHAGALYEAGIMHAHDDLKAVRMILRGAVGQSCCRKAGAITEFIVLVGHHKNACGDGLAPQLSWPDPYLSSPQPTRSQLFSERQEHLRRMLTIRVSTLSTL